MVSLVKKPVVILLVLLVLLADVLTCAAAGAVSASVSPAIVDKGKTVTLTLSLDSASLATPDLSVLEKDFQILKKTNSSSIHQVNGDTLIQKNWVIVLLPRKQGKLHIPVIKIGYERTPPLTVIVQEPPQQAPETVDKNDIFIKVEADIQETYVQGQIVITQKIFHAIPLKKANLSLPVLQPLDKHKQENYQGKAKGRNALREILADIIPLTQTQPYYLRINGKRYHVIERSYALFPRHSGNYQLQSATLTGETSASTNNELLDLLSGAGRSKKVKVRAPVLTLKVKPQQTDRPHEPWLPAKNITLYAKRLNPHQPLEAGKPVSFQLGIIADGLRAEQLPDIKLTLAKDIKIYTEPASLDNTITLFGVTGVWNQKITLIPQHAGDLVIPEFHLPWWNVTTDHREVATLPHQRLSIAKNLAVETIGQGGTGETKTTTLTAQETDDSQSTGSDESSFSKGWIVLALLLALFGYLFYRKKNIKNNSQTPDLEKIDGSDITEKLHQACLDNNAKEAAKLLPLWAEHVAGIYPATMEEIAHAEQGVLQQEISVLSQVLYGKNASPWQGSELWQAIQKYPVTSKEPVQSDSEGVHLQEMYPS